MRLQSILYEEVVNSLGPSGLTVELVPLHSSSFWCLIIEELLKKEDLNNGRREVWEAQWSKGTPVWRDRGSYAVKLETVTGEFRESHCWNFVCLFLHENIMSFLFCHSQNSVPIRRFQKSLSASGFDWTPWKSLSLYNLWASWWGVKKKGACTE